MRNSNSGTAQQGCSAYAQAEVRSEAEYCQVKLLVDVQPEDEDHSPFHSFDAHQSEWLRTERNG